MGNKINVTPLEQDLIDALKEKEQEGIQLLQVNEEENPKQTVKNIRGYVDKLLEENHSEEELREYAL